MLPKNARREERHRAKLLDFNFAPDDKPHRRRLHSSDADRIRIPCLTRTNRIDARKVHSDEPVGATACECRIAQTDKLIIAAQTPQRIRDGFFIQCIEENTSDRLCSQNAKFA